MTTSLRSRLDELAQSFTNGVLEAVRAASIEQLKAESHGGRRAAAAARGRQGPVSARKRGRLARRTQAQIEATLAKVLAALKGTRGKGLRAEEIRETLGLDVREMPRVLKEGLRTRKLKAEGQTRATVYRAR